MVKQFWIFANDEEGNFVDGYEEDDVLMVRLRFCELLDRAQAGWSVSVKRMW